MMGLSSGEVRRIRSGQWLGVAMERQHECSARIGRGGEFLAASAPYCQLMGRSAEALLASNIRDVTHPEDVAATALRLEGLHARHIPHYALEKRYRRTDGSDVWVLETASMARQMNAGPDVAVLS